MRPNAEFIKNIWLEISLHRLIAAPWIMGISFYLLWNFSDEDGYKVVAISSMWVFWILAAFWGSHRAASSLLVERNEGTWLIQKMTSIDAWPMTWGKLFGSTIFAWYCGFWSLLVFFLAVSVPEADQLDWKLLSGGPFFGILYLTVVALFCQAFGLLAGLSLISKEKVFSRGGAGAVLIVTFLLVSYFGAYFTSRMSTDQFSWFGFEFEHFSFILGSLYVFFAWMLTGAYMLMRKELQISNRPMVGLGFLIFVNLYILGFAVGAENVGKTFYDLMVLSLSHAFGTTIFLSYFLFLLEQENPNGLISFFHHVKSKNWRRAQYDFPRWIITAIFALGMGSLLLVYHYSSEYEIPSGEFHPLSFTGAVVCFMLRDTALILWFFHSGKIRKPGPTAMFYFFILYGLIPFLMNATGVDGLYYVVYPNPWAPPLEAILPALLQALPLWVLVATIFRNKWLAAVSPATDRGGGV